MITINCILGNIYHNSDFKLQYENMLKDDKCEKIVITRSESQRLRMRKLSNKNTDIVLIFPKFVQIKHGDVIYFDKEKMVIVELTPEPVGIVQFLGAKDSTIVFNIATKIGHTLGNLHRPINIKNNSIYFPVQGESELEMLEKAFHSLHHYVTIKIDKMIFEPDEGTSIHEH
ncbi:MAG: urease accessory protein UreE [Nitrososphaeraceae archaeon]